MFKKIILTLAVFLSFTSVTHASLTDAEMTSVINSVLNGDVDVLNRLSEGRLDIDTRVACTMGCYSMSPVHATACSFFGTVLQCSQQTNNLGCYWSCQ